MCCVQIIGPLVFTPQETEAMQSLTGMTVHRAKHGDKGIKVLHGVYRFPCSSYSSTNALEQ